MMQSARLEILSHSNLYNIAYYIRTHVYNKRMMLTVNCLPRVLFCILFIDLGPSMRQSPRLETWRSTICVQYPRDEKKL